MIETKDKSQRGRRWAMALAAAVVLPVVLVTALAQGAETVLESFEGTDPVYTTTVAAGVTQEDLGLPESLRAVAALSDEELNLEDGTFVQAQPDAQEAQDYGYTAPEDADALYENGELVVYETEEQEYRVYGSADDTENLWFASDAAGNITGVVLDVPVTWSGSYDPDTPGEYVLTASLSGYTYAQAHPTAVITVEGGGTSLLSDNSGSAEDEIYISEFTVTDIKDGEGPFDTNTTDSNADDYAYRDGNDENDSNLRVRSFDTVTYMLAYTAVGHESTTTLENAYLYFEFVLPLSETEAEWDTDSMPWILAGSWEITTEYRTYDFDGDNTIQDDETDVECQVLRGARYVYNEDGSPVLPGTGSMDAVVQVLASANKTEVTPVFTLWVAGNKAGSNTLYDTEVVTGNTTVCDEHHLVEYATAIPQTVTVTAELRLNVQVKTVASGVQNTRYVIGTYDFNTGTDGLALDMNAGQVYGRSAIYGITLQLYNFEGKGFKGIEYPTGDITFELELSTSFYTSDGEEVSDPDYVMQYYTPLVFTWHPTGIDGYDGRTHADLAWGGASPLYTNTSMSSRQDALYNGGTDWTASRTGNIIEFTVSDYAILYPNFPSSDWGVDQNIYYDPDTGLENIGCFSSLELVVVTPFENNYTGNNVITDLNEQFSLGLESENDGYFVTTVEVVNLKAGSAAGETKDFEDDMNESDDSVSATINLTDRTDSVYGWIVGWTQYGSFDDAFGFRDVMGRVRGADGSWALNGRDALAIDSTVGIGGHLGYSNNGYRGNILYAADVLVKFDGDAVTLTGDYVANESYLNAAGLEVTILYATKANGQNWADDSEMNSTTIEQLVYYSSLTEAQAAGTVVAYLAEFRPIDGDPTKVNTSQTQISLQVMLEATVNSYSSLLGNVYQCVIGGMFWENDEWEDALDEAGGVVANAVPTMAGHGQDGKAVDLPTASRTQYQTYEKVTYNDDGTVTGHTGSNTNGDSLLIVDALTSITKSVAQLDEAGNADDTYDLDNGERIVDYVLESSWSSVPKAVRNTTITITDTLPAGLTYVAGSAYRDGNYTQNSTPGRQGTVSDGEDFEPDVVRNGDGTTTLTWSLMLSTEDEIPKIYYSVRIGTEGNEDTDVQGGDTLTNKATIKTTYDKRLFVESDGNCSSVTIMVAKYFRTALSKTVDQQVYDAGDDMTFTLTSNTVSEIEDAIFLDTLPYSGDSYGSNFTGGLYVTEVALVTDGLSKAGSWEVYYTTNTTARGTVASDYDADDIRNGLSIIGGIIDVGFGVMVGPQVFWQKATVYPDGSVTGIPDDGTVTAIAFVGDLSTGDVFKATVTLQTDAAPADLIVNTLSQNNSDIVVSASVWIASRSITGRAWLDRSKDGQQDAGEDTLEGITVYLLDGDGEIIYDTSGVPVSLVTQIGTEDKETSYTIEITNSQGTDSSIAVRAIALADGSYEFSGLLAGTYGVRFTSSDTVSLQKFLASPTNVGDDYTDSDAKGFYDDLTELLTRTDIRAIVLPAAADISVVNYVSRYNDSGLYYKPGSITIQKNDDNGTGLKDVVFKLEIFDEDTQEWTEVTADTNTTDENGQLVYDDLTPAQYRLTEVATVKGYTLLADSIEITIPYASATAEGTPSYIEGGKTYFLDLTYTIENGQTLVMPNAGPLDSDWRLYLTLGGGVACLAVLGFALSSLRRKRRIGLLRKSLLE